MTDSKPAQRPRQDGPNARGLSRRCFIAAGAGAAGLLVAGSMGITSAADQQGS